MNSQNASKSYTWDDSITVRLSNGIDFKIKLSDHKNAEYVGYVCTSCWESTTLANWECGHCASPFEPKDLEEARNIGHNSDGKAKVESLERLIFMLTHRSWMCKQCDSLNQNYPRAANVTSGTCNCVHCWRGFVEGESILFEDGYSENDIQSATRDYSEKIRETVKEDTEKSANNFQSDSVHSSNRYEFENSDISHKKNKLKVLIWAFGWGVILSYAVYYGFIEKVDYDFEIIDHSSLRTIGIDKYVSKTGEEWERYISPSRYEDFKVTEEYLKEDKSDSYEVQTWTKWVIDRSNCTGYDNPVQQCEIIPEDCDYAVINWVEAKSCTPASKSCYTPSKSCISYGEKEVPEMETRYNKNLYVEFSYKKWEEVNRIWKRISWKKSAWPDMSQYDFSPSTIREWTHQESYSVVIEYNDSKKDMNINEGTWNSLNSWDWCIIQSTRAKWITVDMLKRIDEICELK